jgi:hypothetical protein
VVLVLWDVEAKRGWYALPVTQIDRLSILLGQKKTIGIQFSKEDTFTPESVCQLIWESRFFHAAREVGHAQASREMEIVVDDSDRDGTGGMSPVTTLFLLLRKLGIVTEDGISEDLERMVKNFYNNQFRTDGFETEELALNGGVQLAVLHLAQLAGARGLSTLLWLALSDQATQILRFFHPDLNDWLTS